MKLAGNGTLSIHQDGTASNSTIFAGNDISAVVGVTPTIDVAGITFLTSANTVSFGALNNGSTTDAFTSTFNFTGANAYRESYTSLGLTGSTGGTTSLVPTSTSITIAGNVINQQTSFINQFDTLVLDGTSTGNAINGTISDSSGFAGVGNGDTRVTKQGAGTWTLAGNNTFHGPTTIKAGTLALGNGGKFRGLTTCILYSTGRPWQFHLRRLRSEYHSRQLSSDLSSTAKLSMADNATSTVTCAKGDRQFWVERIRTWKFDIGGTTTATDSLVISGTASNATPGGTITLTNCWHDTALARKLPIDCWRNRVDTIDQSVRAFQSGHSFWRCALSFSLSNSAGSKSPLIAGGEYGRVLEWREQRLEHRSHELELKHRRPGIEERHFNSGPGDRRRFHHYNAVG